MESVLTVVSSPLQIFLSYTRGAKEPWQHVSDADRTHVKTAILTLTLKI